MLFAIQPALAADENGVFMVHGQGTKSCGTFVEAYAEDGWEKQVYGIWVEGYLTAMNGYVYQGQNVAEGTDPAALMLWINNYCHENPLEVLQPATEALLLALLDR